MNVAYYSSKEEMFDLLNKHDLFKEQLILKYVNSGFNQSSDFSHNSDLQSDFLPIIN